MRAAFAKLITVLCAAALMTCTVGAADAPSVSNPYVVTTNQHLKIPLYVNGVRVGHGIRVNGTTYVPIAEFCKGLDRDIAVEWSEETSTVTAKMDGLTVEAIVGTHYISANGRYFYAEHGVQQVNGSVIVPIAELAKAFSVDVIWDVSAWILNVDAQNIAPIAGAEQTYIEDDLYWLSRVINSEAGNQPLEGKMAVGNVVLNRVADPACPDTIYDVIFDRRYGVQFSVTTNGTIYREPNEESVIAAKMCLEGYKVVDKCLFFVNPDIGATLWFRKNRTFVVSIGDHDFYD